MHIKKVLTIFALCSSLMLSACGSSESNKNTENTATPEVQVETTDGKDASSSSLTLNLTAEDANLPLVGNIDENILLETKEGIYYTTRQPMGPDLHYYDKSTGKSIYLCNKPECLHDGNEFCAATNLKYFITGRVAYNNKIFMLAMENTGTETQFKILVASLDGSQLDEFCTFYTVSSGNLESFYTYAHKNLIIHRNKLFANIAFGLSNSGLTDVPIMHGFAVIDLNTKDVKFLTEQPLSETNVTVQNILCQGNYVFYATITPSKPGKKTLCRYDVTTGEVTTYNPQGFRGTFAVLDEDQIAYIRPSSSKVSIYSLSKNTTKDYQVTYCPGDYYSTPAISNGMLFADDNHLYVAYNSMLTISKFYLELLDSGTWNVQTFISSGTDLIWRFDKELSHYTESETAFTLKDEDINSFGKDPGNEFDYCVISQKIDRNDDVDIYDFTIYKDKVLMYEIVPNGDSDTGVLNFFTTGTDSFFSGKPEWTPYMSLEYKNSIRCQYDGSFIAP